MSDIITELTILNKNGKRNFFSDRGVQYVIPLYQRAFAWEDKEILQLIEDINDF